MEKIYENAKTFNNSQKYIASLTCKSNVLGSVFNSKSICVVFKNTFFTKFLANSISNFRVFSQNVQFFQINFWNILFSHNSQQNCLHFKYLFAVCSRIFRKDVQFSPILLFSRLGRMSVYKRKILKINPLFLYQFFLRKISVFLARQNKINIYRWVLLHKLKVENLPSLHAIFFSENILNHAYFWHLKKKKALHITWNYNIW